MSYNEFQRPISVDLVPYGRACEWCGQSAERQLTAIGGTHHNRSGVFCDQCGQQFLECVIRGLLTEKQEHNTRVCIG